MHMLSLFPSLLFMAPLGIALLRVVVGLYLVYTAWCFLGEQDEIHATRIPLFGHLPYAVVWFGGLVYGVLGALLIVGAWTQAVALLALVGFIKAWVFDRAYATIRRFPRSTYTLLIVASLVLLVSGAGSFDFDLPV